MAFIYKITNKINGKLYVGKTEDTIEKRFKQHLSEYNRDRCKNRPLYRAIRKYGKENFEVSLVEETDDPCTREVFWIEFYDSFGNGYNATKGGDGSSYLDESKILEKLIELNLNCHKTANALSHDPATVTRIARKNGLYKKANGGRTASVICVETGVIFERVKDASEWLVNHLNKKCNPHLYSTHISAICRNKRKSLFGFSFKYLNNLTPR